MITLRLAEVADVVGGELVDDADADRSIDDVTIDSRTARPGSLFIALPGEHVDGHHFVTDAAARGASGFLQRSDRSPLDERGGIVVDDPADALLGLGTWVRDEVDPFVVAVTGSSGKTTTKDLVAAAVGARRRTVANPGSYNNELGVPLTCCTLEADTEVLVAEVGARGIGHIASLGPVLAPDVAVVTIVGASHLETLGDIETVARAKYELVESLGTRREPRRERGWSAVGPEGVAVLNADDPRVAAMAEKAACRVVTYGLHAEADWRATEVTHDELARATFTAHPPGAGSSAVRVVLPLPGEHNVSNALAALAVADLAGVDLTAAASALGQATISRWRMQLLRTPGGLVILNDAYNANPASTEAALRTLVNVGTGGRRWAVLGRMAELGASSAEAHAAIGRLCAELGVDGLVAVGPEADTLGEAARAAGLEDVTTVADGDEARRILAGRLGPGDAVLVKASRAVGLEALAEELGLAADEPEAGE